MLYEANMKLTKCLHESYPKSLSKLENSMWNQKVSGDPPLNLVGELTASSNPQLI